LLSIYNSIANAIADLLSNYRFYREDWNCRFTESFFKISRMKIRICRAIKNLFQIKLQIAKQLQILSRMQLQICWVFTKSVAKKIADWLSNYKICHKRNCRFAKQLQIAVPFCWAIKKSSAVKPMKMQICLAISQTLLQMQFCTIAGLLSNDKTYCKCDCRFAE